MEDNMVYIDGRWVKKPTKGRCAYCGSDLLEFYDDGTGICLNCGRTFSWLKPLSGPVPAQSAPQPPPQPQQTRPPVLTQAPQRPPAPRKAPRQAPRQQYQAPVEESQYYGEKKPVSQEHAVFPEGPGFLSPKAVSIMAFIGALLIGIGAIIYILAMPMGSWPKPSDYEMSGNIKKIGLLLWSSGSMLFLMAGFGSAGTREMNYKVRATLIASSVALAILSFSFWLGMGLHP